MAKNREPDDSVDEDKDSWDFIVDEDEESIWGDSCCQVP